MKILFLLDRTDEQGNVVEANVRALEVTPDKLQLRQVAADRTVLAYPVNETDFVPLVAFPIALAQPVSAPAEAPKAAKKTPKKGKKVN